MAPTIAGALGGPLAGAATDALSRAILGQERGTDEALIDAVLAGDPDTLRKLKEAELSFRRTLVEAETRAREIAAADRASARAREIAIKDLTPAILGTAVIGGFFFVMSIMLLRELPARAETEFSIMLGALATMTAAVVNYYFGSSADSREKTKMMGGLR